MKSFSFSAASLLAALVLSTAAVPASAQTSATSGMSMSAAAAPAHPVHVSVCNPQPPTTQTTAFYAPGYYPGPRYYWNDVYGMRYYQPTVTTSSPTLQIDYKNATHKTMSEIEFGLIARGALVAEVKDVGKFSPGIEIKHSFGLSPNVFPLSTGLAQCVPLRIAFADGTKWRNPHLPALRHSIYGPAGAPAHH